MIRLCGVVLNLNKNIYIALQKIYGVGKVNAIYICKEAKILPFIKVKDMNNNMFLSLQGVISKFELEGALRSRIKSDIKRLIDIKCYRGVRHKLNLPVRGQRTKTNAKTRKRKNKLSIYDKKPKKNK